MGYEINVSLNGKHFFATSKRSIQNPDTLKKVFTTINEKFPASEGYTLLITYYREDGRVTDGETLKQAIENGKSIFEFFRS